MPYSPPQIAQDVQRWRRLIPAIETHSDLEISPEINSAFDRLSKRWENAFDKVGCEHEIRTIKGNYRLLPKKQEPEALINLLKDFVGISYKYYTKDEEKFNKFKTELQGVAAPRPAPAPVSSPPLPPSPPRQAPPGVTVVPSIPPTPGAGVTPLTSQVPVLPPLVSVPPVLQQQPATSAAASPPQMSSGRKFRNFLAGHRLALGIAALCILVIGIWSTSQAPKPAGDDTEEVKPGSTLAQVDNESGQVSNGTRYQDGEQGSNDQAGAGDFSEAPDSHSSEPQESGDLLAESDVIDAANKVFEHAKNIYKYYFLKAFLGSTPSGELEEPEAIQLKEKAFADSFLHLNDLNDQYKIQVKEVLRRQAASAPSGLQADLWTTLIPHLDNKDPQLALASVRQFAEADGNKEKQK